MSPQGRPSAGRRKGRGGSDRRRRTPSLTGPPSPYDVQLLERYVPDRGKIRPRSQTGLSRRDQRALSRAIKIARELALLPYRRDAPADGRRPRDRREDGTSS